MGSIVVYEEITITIYYLRVKHEIEEIEKFLDV